MATHKLSTKPQSPETPEEKEAETVRRYREATEAAKSGVLKKKLAESAEAKPKTETRKDETAQD